MILFLICCLCYKSLQIHQHKINSYFVFFSQNLKHISSSDVNIFPFVSLAIKYLSPSAHCLGHIHPWGGR